MQSIGSTAEPGQPPIYACPGFVNAPTCNQIMTHHITPNQCLGDYLGCGVSQAGQCGNIYETRSMCQITRINLQKFKKKWLCEQAFWKSQEKSPPFSRNKSKCRFGNPWWQVGILYVGSTGTQHQGKADILELEEGNLVQLTQEDFVNQGWTAWIRIAVCRAILNGSTMEVTLVLLSGQCPSHRVEPQISLWLCWFMSEWLPFFLSRLS